LIKKITLSIVAPVFNESKNIRSTLDTWYNFLVNCDFIRKFEIILTDDSSTDNTVSIIKEFQLNKKNIFLYKFKKNFGPGAALRNSIKHSKYQYILTIDSDGQFNIKDLSSLYFELKNRQVDVVIGNRIKKKDNLFMIIGSRLSSCLANFLIKSNIKDFNSNFKLVEGNLLRNIDLKDNGMNYSTEITTKLILKKSKISNVNISHKSVLKKKNISTMLFNSFKRLIFVTKLIKFRFHL
jgi:glycosyltransferase involved in cell wall biosynthesis